MAVEIAPSEASSVRHSEVTVWKSFLVVYSKIRLILKRIRLKYRTYMYRT